MSSIVVLPIDERDLDDPDLTALHAAVMTAAPSANVVAPVAGPASSWGARVCAAITLTAPTPPLRIVAFGVTAQVLPAVALAQRSAHRPVVEYVLVAPVAPASSDSWPDAHVVAYATSDSRAMELRGWDVRPIDQLLGDALTWQL